MTEQSVWLGIALLVLLGAFGAIARHGLGLLSRDITHRARRGIIAVNVVGAGAAGYLLTVNHSLGTIVAIGLLGSVTTFSTIAVWIADDIRNREPLAAVRLILHHMMWGVPAVVGGFLLGRFFS